MSAGSDEEVFEEVAETAAEAVSSLIILQFGQQSSDTRKCQQRQGSCSTFLGIEQQVGSASQQGGKGRWRAARRGSRSRVVQC